MMSSDIEMHLHAGTPSALVASEKSAIMDLYRSVSASDHTKATADVWKTDMRLRLDEKNLDSKKNFMPKNDMARLLAVWTVNTMKRTKYIHPGRQQAGRWFHSVDLKLLPRHDQALFAGSRVSILSTAEAPDDSTNTDLHPSDFRTPPPHGLLHMPIRDMLNENTMTENTGIRSASGLQGSVTTAALGMDWKEKSSERK